MLELGRAILDEEVNLHVGGCKKLQLLFGLNMWVFWGVFIPFPTLFMREKKKEKKVFYFILFKCFCHLGMSSISHPQTILLSINLIICILSVINE